MLPATALLSATLALHAVRLPVAPTVASRGAVAASRMLFGAGVEGKTPTNVGEAKEVFNAKYGRPVNGMQQGFINEMITSCTLALVQSSYQPSRVFYLGIDSLCTVFLESVAEDERERLVSALYAGLGMDLTKLQAEAAKLAESAAGKSEEELFAAEDLTALAAAKLKYSYPLGAGILALMPLVDVEPTDESIARWCEKLSLPASRLQKDYAFYKDAQEKMVQVKQMMMEMAAAGKRKEAQKLKDEAEKAAAEAAEAEKAVSAD